MPEADVPRPRRPWLIPLDGAHDLPTLRSRLLDNVVFLMAVAATPGIALSVLRAREMGWQPFMSVQIGILLAAWALYASLPRLSFNTRMMLFSGIFFVAAFGATVQLGPAADARFFLVFITLLAGLLVSARAALISVGVNLLAIALIGGYAVEIGLPLVIDYPVFVRRPSTWWSITYTLTVYGGVIAYVSASLLRHLADSADALRRQKQLGVAILNAQSAFIRSESPQQAFAGLLDDLLEITGSAYGFIGEVRQSGDGARYLKAYAISNIAWDEASRALYETSAANGLEFRNLKTLFGAAMVTGEVVISNQPQSDPRAGGVPAGHPPLTAFVGIPVHTKGRMVALVGLANRPYGYDATLLEFLEPLLSTVGQLVDALHAKRIKDEFVSVVSHELRTPLTALSGALGLVASGALGDIPAKALPLLDIADKNGKRLGRLIDDLLDMEKLASGKLRMALLKQPLLPLVQQSIEANRSYGAARGVRVDLLPQASEVDVEVDADRLQQVLANLLSNAIKFSPDQGVVAVSVTVHGEQVRVEVRDQGPGVPDAFRGKVFEKFSQADSSDTRALGGTGLGLAIAREMIERMGGAIGFESVPGQGACFHFDLPVVGLR